MPAAFRSMFIHATGRVTDEEATYVPESERHKTYWTARVWLLIYVGVVVACVVTRSILPALLIGLPRMYGAWHHLMTGLTQHGGLADNVLDHRLNTRTVYMNPFSRFVYLNMNYHVEHHMFPMVPYPRAARRCTRRSRTICRRRRRASRLRSGSWLPCCGRNGVIPRSTSSANWPPREPRRRRAHGRRRARWRTGSRCVRPTTSTPRT